MGLLRWVLRTVLALATLGTGAVTFLPLLWQLEPRVVALEPMAPQMAAAAAALLLAALLARLRGLALIALAAAAWNVMLIWPDVISWPRAAVAAPGSTLKVVSLNLFYANGDIEGTRAWLAASDADLIGLQEATPALKQALAGLNALYPYRIDCVGVERCEIMLLSKHPLRNAYAGLIDGRYPYIAHAEIDWNGRPLGVGVTHFSWPFMQPEDPLVATTALPDPIPELPGLPRLSQSFQAANVAHYMTTLPADFVLIGDFNGAAWSSVQRALRDATGLDNRGHFLPSWPTWAWPFLRLPIDHVFVRGAPTVLDIHTGADIGSDHLPLMAEIEFKAE